ncbi:MAG: AraC family transcriptional regulator [Eubacteriales bacterium]|nr:AraC family transcriptional regulator [Eubacteriales bacterium]
MITSEYRLHSGASGYDYEAIRLYNSSVPPQNRFLRKHCHTCIELSLFKSGRGFYKTRNHEYEIKPGDVFFFGTNEEHYITRISEPENMQILNIHIDPRFLWMCNNIIPVKRIMEIFLSRSRDFVNRLPQKSESAERITELMLKMENEFRDGKDSYETMVKLYLFEILTCFVRQFDTKRSKSEVILLTYEKFLYINRSVEYIEQNYAKDLTLEELSATAGFSQTYFGALFKQMTGMSPWEYINIKRISRARELLKTTNKTVDSIAAESGYNNITLFNRIFKKITGLTPSQVRGDLQL